MDRYELEAMKALTLQISRVAFALEATLRAQVVDKTAQCPACGCSLVQLKQAKCPVCNTSVKGPDDVDPNREQAQ